MSSIVKPHVLVNIFGIHFYYGRFILIPKNIKSCTTNHLLSRQGPPVGDLFQIRIRGLVENNNKLEGGGEQEAGQGEHGNAWRPGDVIKRTPYCRI